LFVFVLKNLFGRDGTIKLTDFGVSTTLKSEEEFKQVLLFFVFLSS